MSSFGYHSRSKHEIKHYCTLLAWHSASDSHLLRMRPHVDPEVLCVSSASLCDPQAWASYRCSLRSIQSNFRVFTYAYSIKFNGQMSEYRVVPRYAPIQGRSLTTSWTCSLVLALAQRCLVRVALIRIIHALSGAAYHLRYPIG